MSLGVAPWHLFKHRKGIGEEDSSGGFSGDQLHFLRIAWDLGRVVLKLKAQVKEFAVLKVDQEL